MDFYLYRDNYVVKIGEGDQQLEQKLRSQGYELFRQPIRNLQQAQVQQSVWQREIDGKRELGSF